MQCNICPRGCKVDREITSGFCAEKKLKIAKVMLHFWEEPIISGGKGSGAIFFSGCPLKCEYCQNYEISFEGKGEEKTVLDLVDIIKDLEKQGAENINFVTPTHFTNEIIEALKIYKPNIPIVWNTSGYETVETIKKLKDYVDVYLTDLKYFSSELSQKYSKAKDYFEFASQAILEMRKNQPKDVFKNGMMKKGVIVRHLVLPSHYDDSKHVLNWIYEHLGKSTYVSVMSQFTPQKNAKAPLNRKLTPLEYKIVLKECEKLGFQYGFMQELTSATSAYTPKF